MRRKRVRRCSFGILLFEIPDELGSVRIADGITDFIELLVRGLEQFLCLLQLKITKDLGKGRARFLPKQLAQIGFAVTKVVGKPPERNILIIFKHIVHDLQHPALKSCTGIQELHSVPEVLHAVNQSGLQQQGHDFVVIAGFIRLLFIDGEQHIARSQSRPSRPSVQQEIIFAHFQACIQALMPGYRLFFTLLLGESLGGMQKPNTKPNTEPFPSCCFSHDKGVLGSNSRDAFCLKNLS